jgi:hypothetical protein
MLTEPVIKMPVPPGFELNPIKKRRRNLQAEHKGEATE